MNKQLILLILLVFLVQCKKPDFQKQDILVTGTSEPVISLNGIWKFTMNPPEEFWLNEAMPEEWKDIIVPGECAMQGFAIKHNIPYVCKRRIMIPSDYEDKVIKLRFESVYSYARVWVNGDYIRDHSGGFTPWECDITRSVSPGSEAWLTVEFTDLDNDLSYASGYAKHQIGGILRNVSLLALPSNFPGTVFITTRFDQRYRDASLEMKIIRSNTEKAWVGFRMYDRDGKQVRLNDRRYRLRSDTSSFTFRINNPLKWDAENPNLYTLIMEVFDKSILTASFKTRFGFREVSVDGNRLLVNGEVVKLRGACRHDIHPLLGRTATNEYDKKDVLMAKEANFNFIRTSHYPPSEAFLRSCDEYGIYVEDESAVCFVNTHRNRHYASQKQSGPEFMAQQISQVDEMVRNHFNHPSVIIWSLGNESLFNEGFRKCYDLVKSLDKTRPVIFSYPGSVPDSVKCYDLLSMHYPSWRGNTEQWGFKTEGFNYDGIPVIFDEWAHVACYNKPELLEDVNVRNFWGISIDSMWTNLLASEGGTGGAIWGMIDETFMLPDTLSGLNEWWGIQEESEGVKMYEGPNVGYGEWGIADVWRRRKPEFWNTKKAYSPVRIPLTEITDFKAGMPLSIPVYNRFSHTNLKDIIARWSYRGKSALEKPRACEPGREGELVLPLHLWREGEIINIKFLARDSSIIDEYNLRLGKEMTEQYPDPGKEITVDESADGRIEFRSEVFSGHFNRRTGQLENVISGEDTLIRSGPTLHYRYPVKESWSVLPFATDDAGFIPGSVSHHITSDSMLINVRGTKGIIDLNYSLYINGNGNIRIIYTVKGIKQKSMAEEMGLRFITGSSPDSLLWKRRAYWNAYPEYHPGSGKGKTSLSKHNNNVYRNMPGSEWAFDNKSFYYNGLGPSYNLSYMAGSMKENIFSYSLLTKEKKELTVISDASHACRLSKSKGGYTLYINRYWDYLSLKWGNYSKNEFLPEAFTDTVLIRIR